MIVKSTPGILRWGQVMQRGDLPLFVTDDAGDPLDPFSVRYTLYLVPAGRCPQRIGPCLRSPVRANVGEYYITGIAGECGQPGDWYVEWTLQQYFEGPLVSEKFGFKVFDTATYCSGTSTSHQGCSPCRHRGWW